MRLLVALTLAMAAAAGAAGGVGPPATVLGPQRVLVVPVRLPDVTPSRSTPAIAEKVRRVAEWVEAASYGKATLDVTMLGWQPLSRPLAEYRVSPHNYYVDRERVRRLVEDALSAAARQARLEDAACVYIVVGAQTEPGQGYGMIAYAANPGMLSGVRQARARHEVLRLADGREFSGAVIVSADNAHPGHVAHDLLHALGGAREGRRAVPDLYDYDLQSNPPRGVRMHPELFAIHAGPWDIMSQHFIARDQPPPPPSSFTRLQLGWIGAEQVVTVRPGETREIVLEPLESGRGPLVVKIPVERQRYFLLENRQPLGLGTVLPASGLLVLEIDETRPEGSDIVKVVDANPAVRGLAGAPFTPGSGPGNVYVNARDGFAVRPLSVAAGQIRLQVTTPDHVTR